MKKEMEEQDKKIKKIKMKKMPKIPKMQKIIKKKFITLVKIFLHMIKLKMYVKNIMVN